jgi:predicted DNA binding CopG/RHH family protein
MPKLPSFATDEEAAEWFATHDTAPYMDAVEEVTEPIRVARTHPKKKPVGLRIRGDYLDAVKQVAERKGIPYQTLIQMWLVEKLRQEAPELLGQNSTNHKP